MLVLLSFIIYSNLPFMMCKMKTKFNSRSNKMKKIILTLALVGVVVVTMGSVSSVFAQTSTPPAPGTGTGYMHNEMVAVYAEVLGLTIENLDARLDAGETLSQVASSTGMTATEFRDLAITLYEKVTNLAVKNGSITQEQADWMTSRRTSQNIGSGFGASRGAGMGGGRGARGTGIGWNANPDCPFYTGSN
jgi:hypothetical protein